WIVGKLATIGPNSAYLVGPFKLLHDLFGKNVELDGVRINESARDSLWIASLIRVGSVRGWNGPAPADGFLGMRFGILTVQIASIRRLVSLVHLLSQRCERRNLVAEASISTIPACAAAAITA